VDRLFLIVGALAAAVAVAAGAFGAHGLRGTLPPERLEIFETAARYQMYHALALFLAAWLSSRDAGPASLVAGWAFLVGIVLFSGSLYALSLSGTRWLGAITPFGGIAFLVGWISLAWAAATADR
jgi:uncharacterized membrane protein YgdD (TMEM256/DUF423 family)